MSISWEINLDFGQIEAEMLAKIPAAMTKAMEQVRTVVTPMVPKETGALAGSGGVHVIGDTAELFYPGPYALYQHNSIYYRHGHYGAPLHHDNGEPFFLLRGMVQSQGAVMRILSDELLGGV